MNSGDRFRALVLVWIGVLVLAGFTFIDKDMIGVGEVILGVFYMLALMISTLAITIGTGSMRAPSHESEMVAKSTKLKRDETSLIDRMVESMDEEERAALLRRLSAPDDVLLTDDGELKHASRR